MIPNFLYYVFTICICVLRLSGEYYCCYKCQVYMLMIIGLHDVVVSAPVNETVLLLWYYPTAVNVLLCHQLFPRGFHVVSKKETREAASCLLPTDSHVFLQAPTSAQSDVSL